MATVWTETPHQQAPFDLSELENLKLFQFEGVFPHGEHFIVKGEKNLLDTEIIPSISQQLLTAAEENYELYTRESNI